MADYSFIANPEQTNPMNAVRDIIGIAQGAQAYQKGGVELQKARATLASDIAKAKAESSTAQSGATVAAETVQPKITQEQQAAKQAEIKTNLEQYRLTGTEAQIGRDATTALYSDPAVVEGNPEGIIKSLQQQKQSMIDQGLSPTKAEAQYVHAVSTALADPKGFRNFLGNTMKIGLGAQGQATESKPSGPQVSTGQQTSVVNTNALAGPTGVPIQGTVAQQELPPTTPVFNQETNTPGYLGPQPARTVMQGDPTKVMKQLEAIKDPAQREEAIAGYKKQLEEVTAKPVQSGPALGQGAAVAGTVETMNKDWDATQSAAKTASTDIGLLQNIKKFSAGAVTGVESDKRAYISGLAGLLGMKPAELEKTNTDLLAKNTNMLALAGGDTNLARVMAEGANPNTHMTREAISDAANQIIAQRKFALERQKLLQPIKASIDRGLTDPGAYNSALAKINKIDPRVLQLPEMSKEEKTRMMGAMSAAEQDAFIKATREAHALGMGRE